MPARGGSKRIPDKNIKLFNGKPIIYWPLNILKKTKLFDDIIVSTDSLKIKRIVERNGFKVPFLRPKNISDDYTDTPTVIKHALKWYEKKIGNVDYILTVYPTAVFILKKDILDAYEILKKNDCDIVMSSAEFPYPVQRAFYLNKENNIKLFQPKYKLYRSQDLKKSYHDAGQFYFSTKKAILNGISAFSNRGKLLLIPRNRVIDIDNIEDFELAERLFKFYNLKKFHK